MINKVVSTMSYTRGCKAFLLYHYCFISIAFYSRSHTFVINWLNPIFLQFIIFYCDVNGRPVAVG